MQTSEPKIPSQTKKEWKVAAVRAYFEAAQEEGKVTSVSGFYRARCRCPTDEDYASEVLRRLNGGKLNDAIGTDSHIHLVSRSQFMDAVAHVWEEYAARNKSGTEQAAHPSSACKEDLLPLIVPSEIKYMFTHAGNPPPLTELMEEEVMRAIHKLEDACVTLTNGDIHAEMLNVLIRPIDKNEEENPELILERVKPALARLGPDAVRGFMRRHGIRGFTRTRATEVMRLRKMQPEIVLQYSRLILHAYLCVQWHVALTVEGASSTRWCMQDHGLVSKRDGTLDLDEYDLYVKDDAIWVGELDQRLVAPPQERVLFADELAQPPDSPLARVLSSRTHVGTLASKAVGRSGSWTLMPVFNQRGHLVASSVLGNLQTLSLQMIAMLVRFGCGYTATPNAVQTVSTLTELFKYVVESAGITRETPAVLKLDGHFSRLDRDFARLCIANNIYAIIEPSHTSTMFQEGDLGPNQAIHTSYQQQYTNHIEVYDGVLSTESKFRLMILAMSSVSVKCVQHACRKAGVPPGELPDLKRWKVSDFYNGKPFRDPETLPPVTAELLEQIFTLENLARPFGSMISVTIEPGRKQERTPADATLKLAADIAHSPRAPKGEPLKHYRLGQFEESADKASRVMFRGQRPGEADAVPSMEYPGTRQLDELLEGISYEDLTRFRASTTFGLLLIGERALAVLEQAAIRRERVARQTEERKRKRDRDETETQPIREKMVELGFLDPNHVPARLTNTQLDEFAQSQAPREKWPTPYPMKNKGNRDDKVVALRRALESTTGRRRGVEWKRINNAE